MSVKFVSLASCFAFVVVLLMDKDENECAIPGLNYHFHSLYLFICLGVWLSLSLYIGNLLLSIIGREGVKNKLPFFFLRPNILSNIVSLLSFFFLLKMPSELMNRI